MEDSKIKSVCDRIFYMAKKRKSFESILKDLDLKDYELMGLIQLMHQEGYNIDYINGELIIRNKPVKHDDVYQVPNNLDHLKLLLISDKADQEGVQHILHSGDFTDGRSNRAEQVYELREPSYEGQVEYCVDKYPKFNGKTYVIQGNHDD